MSTTQAHPSVQGEGTHRVPKPSGESKRVYVAGAVASAVAFGGFLSIRQMCKQERPNDITKLVPSAFLLLGIACNCYLCFKGAMATSPIAFRQVETGSAMEAGEIQKVDDLVRPLLERINTLITDPKYQQEGSTTEAVNLHDSLVALSQQIDAMTSLLDGLYDRATASEQELDQKTTQLDQQIDQLKQIFEGQVRRLDDKIIELEARVPATETPQVMSAQALLSPAAPAAASPMSSGAQSPAQPSPGTASADLVAALTRDIFAGLEGLKFTGSPGSRGSSRPPSAPGSPSVAVASAPSSFSPSNPTGGPSRKGRPPATPLTKLNED